jgi:hypothetical protein
MGQRFRLRATFDMSGFSPGAQVILKAMKKYGLMVADNGKSWFLQGPPDARWTSSGIAAELRRIRGSDFEAVDVSSLMVNINSAEVRTTAVLDGIILTDNTVGGGNRVTQNSVRLTGVAETGGLTVSLSSSNPAVLSVPPSIKIPEGAATGLFSFTTKPVSSITPVMISAFYLGETVSAPVTVLPPGADSVSWATNPVTGGRGLNVWIYLASVAPPGGIRVSLASSLPTVLKVPSDILVPEDFRAIRILAEIEPVGSNTNVFLNATALGITVQSPALTVLAPVLASIAVPSTTMKRGATQNGVVYLSGPTAAAGMTVSLTSSNPSILTVPASVMVTAGRYAAPFAIRALAGTGSAAVTITARLGTVQKTVVVNVTP